MTPLTSDNWYQPHPMEPVNCLFCNVGTFRITQEVRTFNPPKLPPVNVELLGVKCDSCGKESRYSSQATENLQRLEERRAHYGGHLLGEDYRQPYTFHCISHADIGRLIGKSENTVRRYIMEQSYPDDATRSLLYLMFASPKAMSKLADYHSVTNIRKSPSLTFLFRRGA